MPRRSRRGSGGLLFHVLNRAIRRSTLFRDDHDYAFFERLLLSARQREPVSLLSLMPTHFHLVLWPEKDEQLSEFMRWLTVTHTQHLHTARGTAGTGPIYQGRFKSFPIQSDRHLLCVCRYVERNALRAGLCKRAEDWRWSGLWHHCRNGNQFLLDAWPIQRPSDWLEDINRPDEPELEDLRRSVQRGAPFGAKEWVQDTALRLGIVRSTQPRGRPPYSRK
jgi:putative transposase